MHTDKQSDELDVKNCYPVLTEFLKTIFELQLNVAITPKSKELLKTEINALSHWVKESVDWEQYIIYHEQNDEKQDEEVLRNAALLYLGEILLLLHKTVETALDQAEQEGYQIH